MTQKDAETLIYDAFRGAAADLIDRLRWAKTSPRDTEVTVNIGPVLTYPVFAVNYPIYDPNGEA